MITMKWAPWLLLLAGCAAAASDPPMTPPPVAQTDPKEPGVTRNLAYGDAASQALDLYVPTDQTNEPLVVFVHGGAWQGGGRVEYDPMCAQLFKQGIAAATVDYRLSPTVKHPRHATDVAEAIHWLRDHAEKYHYNPNKIFIVGHSAGAHIAATIATTLGLFAQSKPAGFVGLEGIYDIPNLAKHWPAYPNWFLNNAFGADEKAWPTASPTRLKPVTQTPWLLVHSKTDELVDLGQTDDFAAHLRKSGVPVQLLHTDHKGHDEVVHSLIKTDDDVMKAILEFVKSR